ncbi:MAG: peptidoglycan DD-metalloendopeptidase family protein [Janthinobacterium lividum]
MSRGIWYLYFTVFLAACGQRKDPPAPVSFGIEESNSSEDFDSSVQSQNSGSMISYIDPEQEIKPVLQAEKIIIVKPQENLAVITERYQIDREDIIARNNLMAPYYLFPGQKLKLPASARLQPTPLKKTPLKKDQPDESLDMSNDLESDQDTLVSQKKPTLKKELRRSVEDREKELEDKFSKLEADLKKSKLSKKTDQKDEQSNDDTVKIPGKKPDSLSTKNKDKTLTKEQEKSSKDIVAEDALESEAEISTDKKLDSEKSKVKNAEPAEITSFKLGSPLAGNIRDKIVSDFNQTTGKIKNDGINIKADANAPILAAQGGQVVYAGNEMQGFGNLILLKHEGGWMTAYGHCAEILVKEKQVVKQGETIAKVGNTGSVRDAQLHFQLRKKSTVVDPKLYLE